MEINMKCEYNCGNEAKFKTKAGKNICEKSPNSCPANKLKNSLKTKKAAEKRDYKKVYENISSETKEKMNWNKDNISADFSYNGKGQHKKVLMKERGHKCQRCNLKEWLNQPITLELEHIDGDNKNNVKDNLELLCPNCHSYTDTWRGRNISKSPKDYVTETELINAINTSKSIRQALISLRLTPKGGNYERPKKLIELGKAKLIK
jgi:5-methylcytosine-specific restriction endonuclease McrA